MAEVAAVGVAESRPVAAVGRIAIVILFCMVHLAMERIHVTLKIALLPKKAADGYGEKNVMACANITFSLELAAHHQIRITDNLP